MSSAVEINLDNAEDHFVVINEMVRFGKVRKKFNV